MYLVTIFASVTLVSGGCSNGSADSAGDSGVVSAVAVSDRILLPSVGGRLLDGAQFQSDDYAGAVLVFNVWGSWCPPCRAEAPALQQVSDETEARGAQFIGVDVKDNDASARAFERQFGITYPSIVTADSDAVLLAFRASLPPNAIPSTLIVDREGRVAVRIVGATTYSVLSRLVDQVLTERQ